MTTILQFIIPFLTLLSILNSTKGLFTSDRYFLTRNTRFRPLTTWTYEFVYATFPDYPEFKIKIEGDIGKPPCVINFPLMREVMRPLQMDSLANGKLVLTFLALATKPYSHYYVLNKVVEMEECNAIEVKTEINVTSVLDRDLIKVLTGEAEFDLFLKNHEICEEDKGCRLTFNDTGALLNATEFEVYEDMTGWSINTVGDHDFSKGYFYSVFTKNETKLMKMDQDFQVEVEITTDNTFLHSDHNGHLSRCRGVSAQMIECEMMNAEMNTVRASTMINAYMYKDYVRRARMFNLSDGRVLILFVLQVYDQPEEDGFSSYLLRIDQFGSIVGPKKFQPEICKDIVDVSMIAARDNSYCISSFTAEIENMKEEATVLKFDNLTSLYVYLLRFLAILPMENRNYDFFVTRFLNLFCFASGITHVSMFLIYAYNLIVQFKGMLGLDYVCEFVMVAGCAIRYYMVSRIREQFLELHLKCESLWQSCTAHEHYTVDHFAKKIRIVFKCNAFVSLMLSALYMFSALTTRLPPLQPNGTEARITPFRMYVNGAESSSVYWTIFSAQSVILQMALIIALGIDTAAPFIIMFECGFLRVLQERFLSISGKRVHSKDADDDEYKKIVACSKFHQSILNLSENTKKFAGGLFFAQILSTGYNLSLSGIKLAGTDPDRYKFVSTFGVCLAELFVIQWTPDFLVEESEAVATAAYFAFLSNMNPRTGKLLLIIMQRARRPEQMVAGGIVKMSIESFGSMLTSAFSFFTVLRKFEQS